MVSGSVVDSCVHDKLFARSINDRNVSQLRELQVFCRLTLLAFSIISQHNCLETDDCGCKSVLTRVGFTVEGPRCIKMWRFLSVTTNLGYENSSFLPFILYGGKR
jgi:hypothetical protein